MKTAEFVGEGIILSLMSSVCIQKSGDNSKPSMSFQTFARIKALFSWRVLQVLVALTTIAISLTAYYLYLDQRYLIDEVLAGTKLREMSIKEKVTIRLVAPRKLEDLNKFIMEYSICQPVHEIQIVWLHEQLQPSASHFKYQHTHSKVSFFDKFGLSAYDALYGDIKAETAGKTSTFCCY